MTARRVTDWRRISAAVIRFSFALRVSLSGDVDDAICVAARAWRSVVYFA
jgi:hypothetical protein